MSALARDTLALFLLGCAGIVLVNLAPGCGAPVLAECQLAAVSALPLQDPDALSLRDVRELARALKDCQAPAVDAGGH